AACGGAAAPVHNEGRNAGPVDVAWVTEPRGDRVAVSLVVGGTPVPVGELDGTFDDPTAFIATKAECRVMDDRASPATTAFIWGATSPRVQFYVAAIEGDQLVIARHSVMRHSALEQIGPGETHEEIKRISIAGTSLV